MDCTASASSVEQSECVDMHGSCDSPVASPPSPLTREIMRGQEQLRQELADSDTACVSNPSMPTASDAAVPSLRQSLDRHCRQSESPSEGPVRQFKWGACPKCKCAMSPHIFSAQSAVSRRGRAFLLLGCT